MISSTSNQKVKEIIALKKTAKTRRETGLFVVEGIKMFAEADSRNIKSTYVSEEFLCNYESESLLKKCTYEIVTDSVMKAMSDTVNPQGILCVMKQQSFKLDEILVTKKPHLILLDDIQDPGNAGTIIRTAEAAGIDAVILSHNCVDIYNPKTIRSTMGAIYRVKFIYADLPEVISILKDKGIIVYSTDMHGTSFRKVRYDEGCAIVIGNEANGVSREIDKMADVRISIPMKGSVESLNAAVAAALLMFESVRKEN